MDSPGAISYLSIALLICLSAFFSASETALTSFNRIRLKKQAQDGDKAAQNTLGLAERYDKTLSTILIGNNIVNIAASALATVIATTLLGGSAGPVVATIAMTLLVLVFGEILPKNYAVTNADKVALLVTGPLHFICKIFSPLSFFFLKLSSAFSRSSDPAASTPTVTEEELMYFIDSIEEEGVIEEQERDLVQSALEFDEVTIREVITPRVDLVAIDIEDSPERITELILEEGYSRIPVFEHSIDNIIGILYARDFLRCIVRGEQVQTLREMLHEPYFVHKSMRLPQLLTGLKARQVNLAVVLDEYGGTLGIVTMEDILEELVGDIWDEDDEIPGGLIQLSEGLYEVDGGYEIDDMFEELGWEQYDPEGEHTTVSGWAMHLLEHIPKAGESFDFSNYHCTVLEMDGRRITRLQLERRPSLADDMINEK